MPIRVQANLLRVSSFLLEASDYKEPISAKLRRVATALTSAKQITEEEVAEIASKLDPVQRQGLLEWLRESEDFDFMPRKDRISYPGKYKNRVTRHFRNIL